MSYEIQRAVDRILAFSSNKQTTFGTALGDAALTRRPRLTDAALGVLAQTFFNDAERFNKPDEFPSLLIRKTQQFSLAVGLDLTSEMAGLIAAFGMGKVVTTTPDGVGAPTGRQHVISFSTPAVSKKPPVTTIAEKATADIGRKLLDMAVADFVISGRGGADAGPLALAANFLGSGKEAAAPGSFPALAAGEVLFNADLDILLGPEGAPVTIKDRVLDWSVSVTQNLDFRYHPGSGEVAGLVFHGLRQPSVSLRLFAKEVDDILALFKGTASKELKLTVEGAVIGAAVKHKLEIRLPALRITALDSALEGANYVWTITFGPEGIFKGATLTEPLQILVVNTDANLLVAA